MRSVPALVLALAVGQAISATIPFSLETRANPAAVTCTTEGKETKFTEGDVSDAFNKFKSLINENPKDWPKGPGKKNPRSYPSRNKLAKTTDEAKDEVEKECPLGKDEQWWEYPLIKGTYDGGDPSANRLITVVTDNGEGAHGDRYTDIKYCASVAYVKTDKARLGLCK